MTAKLDNFTRTVKAKQLFMRFFDSDEDYFAFNLKYRVKVFNDKYHAYVSVVDEAGEHAVYENKPSQITHNSATWRHGKGVLMSLNFGGVRGSLHVTAQNNESGQTTLVNVARLIAFNTSKA